MWKKLRDFLVEVRKELENVTWPTKDDIVSSTVVTLVTVLIVSTYLFCVSWMIRRGFEMLYRIPS